MGELDLDRRMLLQKYLEALPEVKRAYFQPSESSQMVYPCAVYNWERLDTKYADDKLYLSKRGYLITFIDSNPDSAIPILFHRNFPTARFDRHYTSDNMNHWVYSLFW